MTFLISLTVVGRFFEIVKTAANYSDDIDSCWSWKVEDEKVLESFDWPGSQAGQISSLKISNDSIGIRAIRAARSKALENRFPAL